MTEPTLRRLTYADLPSVVAIERRAFPAPWSLAMFVLELGKPGGVCLVATEGERVVGYCICSRFHDVWHLMDIAVDPGRRRRGVATALVRGLLERLPTPEDQITLEVRRSNHGAQDLYVGFGFKPAGVRRRYYADNGEDAVIMWRTPGSLQGRLDDTGVSAPLAAQRAAPPG